MEFLRVSLLGTWMSQLTLDGAIMHSATPAPSAALSDGGQSEEEPVYEAPDPDRMTTPRVWIAKSPEAASIVEDERTEGTSANEAEGTFANEAEGSAQVDDDASMLEEREQILQESGDEVASTSSSTSTSSSSSSSSSEVAMEVDAVAASGDEEGPEVHMQEGLGWGRGGRTCARGFRCSLV
jgi:hypothetical protein